MGTPGVDEVIAVVRNVGGRMTATKRATIEEVVAHGADHLTAEDIASKVVARLPDTHLSTVYRILNDLEGLGVLRHVHLGHGPSTYHLAEDRHHHAVCDDCGAVLELPAEVFDGVAATLADQYGFALRAPHFALGGRCAACVSASR